MEIQRIGTFTLGWGERLVWDERRQRLYFVDCGALTLHWLEDGNGDLSTVAAPSMPTGIVPTEDGRLVVVLADGLHLFDPDSRSWEMLAPYPDAVGGRCNDMCADPVGNLITGRLNLLPGEGSAWWYSHADGWRLLDPDIVNTNGPQAAVLGGAMTLIVGDTAAHYYRYAYDPTTGAVGDREVFGDVTELDGHPDGSTLDESGGLWCALYGGAQLARFTTDGLDQTLAVPTSNPTDLTFGGPRLDRLYVVSTTGDEELDGTLLRIDCLDHVGRPEPRFRVA